MAKTKIPSDAQAKMIAHHWSDWRHLRIMKRGRDNTEPYIEPTTNVLLKNGWIEPSGNLEYMENGYLWEGYTVSEAGLLALESYLQKRRFKVAA